MTINELIDRLEELKEEYGGHIKVKVSDTHPWTPNRIYFHDMEEIVYIDYKD